MFNKKRKLKTLQVVDADGKPQPQPKPAPKTESTPLQSPIDPDIKRPANRLTDLDLKRIHNLPDNVMTYIDERLVRIEAQAKKTARWAAFWRTLTVIVFIVACFAIFYVYLESQDIQSLVRQVKQETKLIHNMVGN